MIFALLLGGFANICYAFATKRYRSNCINWGIVPFTLDKDAVFSAEAGDCVFVPDIRAGIAEGREEFCAALLRRDGSIEPLRLFVNGLTDDERQILLDGCLMNHYKFRAEREG